jgi:Zn-dependent M28 family amino/carboxypeptidase
LARRKPFVAALAFALVVVSASGVADAHHPRPPKDVCKNRNNNTYDKLLECVKVEGVREHQAALQAIADRNGGNRADQTDGYLRSVKYVVQTLDRAGWDVKKVPFEYPSSDVVLQQLTPPPTTPTYETGGFTGTGFGDVTGAVIPIDINLVGDRANTSGCEPADFAAADLSGTTDIVLVQRGTCFFARKAFEAQAAGAEAVIIFNQGNTPEREGFFVGDASALEDGAPTNLTIPVIGASFAAGAALAAAGSTARVSVVAVTRTSFNVIAELEGKNDKNVVMAGAHLDSVPAGPGIQDNGSGSAALLEVAEQLGDHKPQNTVRFAWWGAEELGLLGSTAYVNGLSEKKLDRIALYLNFDMIGSPNYMFMVYDANESTHPAPVPVPEGSIAIESLFESFYTYAGEPYDDTEFSGRSDYEAFIANGIPSSGLFTGAEVPKSEAQAAIWGGTVGDQFDPCYHAACDNFDNISLHALDVNTDAVAFSVLTYAYSTETVNGVRGKKVPGHFEIPAPAGPQGTTGVTDGGLAHNGPLEVS